MVIDSPAAQRFIATYMAFLGSLLSVKDMAGKSTTKLLVLGRDRYSADRGLLDGYRAANPKADGAMLEAIARMHIGTWVHLKDTRTYSVLLDAEAEHAYAALGLTQRIRDVGDQGTGLFMEAGLMPLNGRWVCDGLLANPVWLGPNTRRDCTAQYQALRQNGQFSTAPQEPL